MCICLNVSGPVFSDCGFEDGTCGWESSKDSEDLDWWIRTSAEQAEAEGYQAPPKDFEDTKTGE